MLEWDILLVVLDGILEFNGQVLQKNKRAE